MALTRVKKVPTANLVQGSSFLTSVAASNMTVGTIIQVKRNVGTTEYSTTSTSTYLNIADINTTITPKSASSVLFFQMSGLLFITGMSAGQSGCHFRLEDDTNSTVIAQYRGVNFTNNNGSNYQTQSMQQFCFNFSTAASNTNAREYRLEFRIEPSFNNCSSAVVGWPDNSTSAQSMVIYEIAL